MIESFPTLERDELLYSGFARFRMLFGYRSHRGLSTILFGTRNQTAIVALPSAIDRFAENLLPGTRYTAEYLIEEHTLLPYFARFVAAGTRTRAVQSMRSQGKSYITNLLGLGRHDPTPARLQFCLDCAREDAQLSEAYWHRVHQLPGVLVCPRHGTVLLAGQTRCPDMKAVFVYHALAELQGCDGERLLIPRERRDVLFRLARMSEWVLHTSTAPVSTAHIATRYRELLSDYGWLYRVGGQRVRLTAFRDALLSLYGEALLHSWRCKIPADVDDVSSSWLQKHCSGSLLSHPLRHLLVLTAIGPAVGPEDLFQPIVRPRVVLARTATSGAAKRRKGRRSRSPCRCVDWRSRDETWRILVRDAASRLISRPGKPERLTIASVGREAGIRATLVARADRLPRTHRYLAGVVESVETFTVRRIAWWARAYATSGQRAPAWVLLERAGVSRSTIPVFGRVLDRFAGEIVRALEGGDPVSAPPLAPSRLKRWSERLLRH